MKKNIDFDKVYSKIENYNKLINYCKSEFNLQETLNLLKHNILIFGSWGPSKFTAIEQKGLLFKVNGRYHKGYVLITLSYDDLYNVRILNKIYECIDEYSDIYFDTLVDTIDERIETYGKVKN